MGKLDDLGLELVDLLFQRMGLVWVLFIMLEWMLQVLLVLGDLGFDLGDVGLELVGVRLQLVDVGL